jgi:hypothetical protein
VIVMSYVVTVPELLDSHTVLDISCLDRIYLQVILSFRVTRGCDLRRLAEDGVFGETGAA